MEIVFIDHYDSFSYNVKEWVRRSLPSEVSITHVFYDDREKLENLSRELKPLILSPGPGHPSSAASTLSLVRSRLGRVPILGICLGHQILGIVGGASIVRSKAPFHGSVRKITLKRQLFHQPVGSTLEMGVYHSLVVSEHDLKDPWHVLAVDELGEVAALEFAVAPSVDTSLWGQKNWPAVGLQFHPESFLSIDSDPLIKGWIERDIIPWFEQTQPAIFPQRHRQNGAQNSNPAWQNQRPDQSREPVSLYRGSCESPGYETWDFQREMQ